MKKLIIILLISFNLTGCAMYPPYRVWEQEMAGKAELERAKWNKQVQIEDAKGKLEASKNLAESEIQKAKGIAEANKIISSSITPEYLKYKFIENLGTGNKEVIYVPTESNLPITESTRFNKPTTLNK